MWKILFETFKPSTFTCKNGNYLECIVRDLVVICDEIIEVTKTNRTKIGSTKTILTNFKE